MQSELRLRHAGAGERSSIVDTTDYHYHLERASASPGSPAAISNTTFGSGSSGAHFISGLIFPVLIIFKYNYF